MEITIIIKVVLALIFTLAVIGKLTGKTKSTFENAGFSPAVMYATAVAEIVFTVGLFTRYELFAALGLLAVIGGAIYALLRQKATPAHYALPVITVILLLALLGFILA
ncbi:MAG: DoxX family protein [Ignavibacteria bacterium]|nr:DoxX family protein [Ignavibacteria bacterium]